MYISTTACCLNTHNAIFLMKYKIKRLSEGEKAKEGFWWRGSQKSLPEDFYFLSFLLSSLSFPPSPPLCLISPFCYLSVAYSSLHLHLTLRGAAGGSGGSGSGRRGSGAWSVACQVVCGPGSRQHAGTRVTRTACARPVWRRLCPGPRPSSCWERRTQARGGPVPWRCLCHGSASPRTCGEAQACCRLRGLVLLRCPPHGPPAWPPRSTSLERGTEQCGHVTTMTPPCHSDGAKQFKSNAIIFLFTVVMLTIPKETHQHLKVIMSWWLLQKVTVVIRATHLCLQPPSCQLTQVPLWFQMMHVFLLRYLSLSSQMINLTIMLPSQMHTLLFGPGITIQPCSSNALQIKMTFFQNCRY